MSFSYQIHGSMPYGTLRKNFSYQQFIRHASVLKRVSAELNEYVSKAVEGKEVKPRQHPGIMPHAPYSLPKPVKSCIAKLLKDGPKKQLLEESKIFNRFLLSRQLPSENERMNEILSSIEAEVKESLGYDPEQLNEEELQRYNVIKKSKINSIMKQRIYNWKRLSFTNYSALLYLITRSAAEYSVVSRVLSEISIRTSLKPKRIFDFGSGLGSVIWAANEIWGKSILEYYCVDSSGVILELLETIINEYEDSDFCKRIFTRQFLPSSNEVCSDIVVSAYSFIELPSSSSRLETLKNLWNKTDQFLVLIEAGTLAGFKIINEARDFLLSGKLNEEGKVPHVFAPCPHNLPCPRVSTQNICYFQSTYSRYPQIPEQLRKEHFCYLVVQKGPSEIKEELWPRIVQPVLHRSRHTICRFCSSSGHLNEVVFSPGKNGTIAYRCAKASKWGDLFPCKFMDNEKNSLPSNENSSDETK